MLGGRGWPRADGGPMKREFHPLTEAIPPMTDAELARLVDSIRRFGVIYPVLLTHDGRIIDGRARYLACQQLGIEPRYEILPADTDLAAVLISMNLRRR
jgi:ParB-like chromosome segregation protein Spo0J